jgi:hypothetical protein
VYFIGKEFLSICFDKERNKMAENKIIKKQTAIIFMSFVLIAATIITVKMNSSTFMILIFLTLRE